MTKPKSNSVITTEVVNDADGQPVKIIFTVKDAGTTELDLTKVHINNVRYAALHGFTQRISDAAALGRDKTTGAVASPTVKLDRMSALCDWYNEGNEKWSRVGSGEARGGLLFMALCEMYPDQTPDQIRDFLAGLSDAEVAALREDDEVAPRIKALKDKRDAGKPKADTKALLAGLVKKEEPTQE